MDVQWGFSLSVRSRLCLTDTLKFICAQCSISCSAMNINNLSFLHPDIVTTSVTSVRFLSCISLHPQTHPKKMFTRDLALAHNILKFYLFSDQAIELRVSEISSQTPPRNRKQTFGDETKFIQLLNLSVL